MVGHIAWQGGRTLGRKYKHRKAMLRCANDSPPMDSLLFRGACVLGEAGAPPATPSASRRRSTACQAMALAALGAWWIRGMVRAAH
jgi:hypothetical protein